MTFGSPVPRLAKKERQAPDWLQVEISDQTKKEVEDIKDNIRRAKQNASLLLMD